MANVFTGDPNCCALWRMESGALTTDSIGGNTLTNSSVGEDTVNYKEGSCASDYNSTSDRLYITDANLDSGFPLKNGDTNKKISICIWFRASGFPVSEDRHIVGKWQAGKRSIILFIDCDASPDNQPSFSLGYNNGDSGERVNFGTGISAGQWYHFGFTYDDSDKSYKMRIWDDNASALLGGAEVTGNTTNNINVEDANWQIGTQHGYTAGLGGEKDECVVFKDILTSDEIDDIRQGQYDGEKIYTRGDYAALPSNDADLETAFDGDDREKVAVNDADRLPQTATDEFAIFEFKDYAGSNTQIDVTCDCQSDLAPSSSTVYLQIYNQNTPAWETLDSNSATGANTDFELSGTKNDLTNYKDGNNYVSCRVYQEAT